MSDIHNVFISHYSEDDDELHRLKQRLTDRGCTVRNSSVEKGDPPYPMMLDARTEVLISALPFPNMRSVSLLAVSAFCSDLREYPNSS